MVKLTSDDIRIFDELYHLPVLRIDQVVECVSRKKGIAEKEITSTRKFKELVQARTVASAVYRRRFGLSFSTIASLLHRDYSTFVTQMQEFAEGYQTLQQHPPPENPHPEWHFVSLVHNIFLEKGVTPDKVREMVWSRSGLPWELREKQLHAPEIIIKQGIDWILRERFYHPWEAIGQMTGRNHSTCLTEAKEFHHQLATYLGSLPLPGMGENIFLPSDWNPYDGLYNDPNNHERKKKRKRKEPHQERASEIFKNGLRRTFQDVDEVIRYVVEESGLPLEDILGAKNPGRAYKKMMYALAHSQLDASYPELGAGFGVGHSTVLVQGKKFLRETNLKNMDNPHNLNDDYQLAFSF